MLKTRDGARRLPLAQGAGDVTRHRGRGYLSPSPRVVYRERDRELVEAVPLESLLVESDAPWHKGDSRACRRAWLCARELKRWPRSSACLSRKQYRLSVNTCHLFDLVWA